MIVIEYLYFPETRNVPLEEVAAMFGVRLHQILLPEEDELY